MKKIINIAVLLAFCMIFVSCSDDDDKADNSLKPLAVKDLSFSSKGGVGTITMSTDNITATVEDGTWATVSVSGSIISVTAKPNGDITSRNTNVIIKSGNESTSVPVNQLGSVFYYEVLGSTRFDLSGGTVKVKIVEFSMDYDIIVPDEITYTQDNDSVYSFLLASSTSLRYPEIKFSFNNGERVVKIVLSQNILKYNDLLGDWNLTYLDENGVSQLLPVSIKQAEAGKSYTMSSLPVTESKNLDITLTFVESTGEIYIQNQQSLGSYPRGIYRNLFYDESLSIKASASDKAGVQYYGYLDLKSTAGTIFNFGDNGTWDGYAVGAMALTQYARGEDTPLKFYKKMSLTKK